MARLIRVTECGPVKVEPQNQSVWICQCGLSQNKPYCDGSHTRTRDEPKGSLCIYNAVTQSRQMEVEDSEDLRELLRSDAES